MKRFLLIAGSAALLLTSCSEEKFLNDVGLQEANKVTKTPIGFQASQPNQSRAPIALEDKTSDFGIFGIKADSRDDINTNVFTSELTEINHSSQHAQLVFNNYLVGWSNKYPLKEGGYTETGSPFSSAWYYEGLGAKEYTYPAEVSTSAWDNQYLKYWDGSKKFTYFVAYTPYDNTANAPVLKKGKDANHIFQLECKTPISLGDTKSFLYAARQELVSSHFSTTQTDVPLLFNRCQSEIRIAFYEVIKGYKVKMIKVDTDYGVTALPYNEEKTDLKGEILSKGTPIFHFKNPTSTTEAENLICDQIEYKKETKGYDVLNFPLPDEDPYLNELRSDKIFAGNSCFVIPGATTDQLQFVLSFTLEAEDTHEIITVKNARVNVPATYTNWQPNCLYTYIFKITKDTNGTTATPDTDDKATLPIDLSTTGKALYPIVFDELKVAEIMDGTTTEYTLYDSSAPTATGEIFNSDPAVKDYATVKAGETLNLIDYLAPAYQTEFADDSNLFEFSVNDELAEIDDDGVLTAKAAAVGKSFPVSVTYTKDGTIDTIIVTVIGNDMFLKSSVIECHVNDVNKLSELLKSGVATNEVALSIYNPSTMDFVDLSADADETDYKFTNITTDPADKTIQFKTANTYLIKAVYTHDSDPVKTGYIQVNVLSFINKQGSTPNGIPTL